MVIIIILKRYTDDYFLVTLFFRDIRRGLLIQLITD